MSHKQNQKTIQKGDLVVHGDVDMSNAASVTPLGPEAVTATADGLTTGLIPAHPGFVVITASDADHIATLPDGSDSDDVGMVVAGYVGANGCELRTPASSDATINNVDSDGTQEAALPATTIFEARLVAVDTWILRAWDELGAVITAIVPD